MINKHKIIDAFLFYNEVDMLEFRLTELNEYVDFFVILESSFDFQGNKKDSVFKSSMERFDTWKDKIIHIECPELCPSVIESARKKYPLVIGEVENYQVNKDNIVFYMTDKLRDFLATLDINFEDIVLWSDVDEIPDFNNFNSLLDLLVFDSVFLKHKRFFWTTKYVDKELCYGTSVHQYTRILQNPLMLRGYYRLKASNQFSNHTSIESGWHFSHFEDIGKLHEKFELINGQPYSLKDLKIKMNNLIPIKYPDLRDEYCLTNYSGNLPINIHLLPEQAVRRNWKRNILVKSKNLVSNIDDYTEIIEVLFIDSIPEKINKFSILLPQNILYGDHEEIAEFQMEYGYNELKKIVKNLYLLNDDTVTFNFGEPKKFTWSEIKNEYIADLI